MNEITTDIAVTEAGVAEAPVLVFNAETGTFEAVTETEVTVTDEGTVATPADVTLN